MSKAFIFMADGFEPVELVAPTDILRRGGVEVTLVSTMPHKEVRGAHGISIVADAMLEEVDVSQADAVILPGGSEGVENLGRCKTLLHELSLRMSEGNKIVGAICAAPMILADNNLLEERRAVCYPSCESNFPYGAYQPELDVCVDANLITATGPGTAFQFGFSLLATLEGTEVAQAVAAAMLAQ